MKALHFEDSPCMPGTGASPEEILASALPLAGTVGQTYVERRGIPVEVAAENGLHFDADFGGRPAVIAPLYDEKGRLSSIHGRYLHTQRGQNKMLTIGHGNGMINALDGWHAETLIIVEGLFDALSLATCGWSCIAPIGRWASWLPEVTTGRVVWIGFDAGRPGEADAMHYRQRLSGADIRRLLPPAGCKDWNTALVKRGRGAVTRWLQDHIHQNNG